MKCIIKLIWCDDESFWYSESLCDKFAMTLESGSLDVLIERVRTAVPDMLECVGYTGDIDLSFEIDKKYKLVAS